MAQQAPAVAPPLGAVLAAALIAAAGTWRTALLAIVASGAVLATRARFATHAAATVLTAATALTVLSP